MNFGITKEFKEIKATEEIRVGLSPRGVMELVHMGASVYVESGAGEGARFSDRDYRDAGAHIVYNKEEVVKRSDVVLKIRCPNAEECELMKDGQTVMGYLHLAVSPRSIINSLLKKKITAIGYEIIQKPDGTLPVLRPMSQIAGRMAVQIAGRLLESRKAGRRGILLSGIPGIPPAEVVIVGAGTLGFCAAKAFSGIGASVYIVDRDIDKLERVESMLGGRVVTMLYNKRNLEKLLQFADVVICAVLVPGARTPILISRDMVRNMKKGAVLIDFSIDQGGCSETTRLTPGEDFVYEDEGVIHFAVPNVPSRVARTATHALTNAILPYLKQMIELGVDKALLENPDLRNGVYTYRGYVTNKNIARENVEYRELEELLKGVE